MVRLKSRYILFEVLDPEDPDNRALDRSLRGPHRNIDFRRVFAEIKDSIYLNFGEQGMASVQMTLMLKYFNPKTRTGILRVSRDHWRIVQAALTYISAIENHKVTLRVTRVSGTIKKSQMWAIGQDEAYIADSIADL